MSNDIEVLRDKLRDSYVHYLHCCDVAKAYDTVLDDIDDWAGDDWQLVKSRLKDMREDVIEERDRLHLIVQELSQTVPL